MRFSLQKRETELIIANIFNRFRQLPVFVSFIMIGPLTWEREIAGRYLSPFEQETPSHVAQPRRKAAEVSPGLAWSAEASSRAGRSSD